MVAGGVRYRPPGGVGGDLVRLAALDLLGAFGLLGALDLLEALAAGVLDALEPLVAMAIDAEGCNECGFR